MKKRVKVSPHRIVFLIILLAGNTFAWFIYSTKVDSNISVHVKAWDVVFQAGDDQVSTDINIIVDDIYPGMTSFSRSITAYNYSEVPASLSFKIMSATVLDEEYITVEGRAEAGDDPDPDDLTSQQLATKLANDYPFTIAITMTSSTIAAGNGEGTYTLSVVWPYESGDDETDTEWGIAAAEYKESNPSDPSITLTLKLIITQNLS